MLAGGGGGFGIHDGLISNNRNGLFKVKSSPTKTGLADQTCAKNAHPVPTRFESNAMTPETPNPIESIGNRLAYRNL